MGVKRSAITENGSIIDALITDRTASDVSEAVSLAQKISAGNATEADVPYFEGIRGLSAPIYRDGTIYLHILSDEEWRNSESVTVFENEIRKRMEASGNEALLPTAFSYEYAHGISTDPSHLLLHQYYCSLSIHYLNLLILWFLHIQL